MADKKRNSPEGTIDKKVNLVESFIYLIKIAESGRPLITSRIGDHLDCDDSARRYLVDKGLVTHQSGKPTEFYKLTEKGRQVYRSLNETLAEILTDLPTLEKQMIPCVLELTPDDPFFMAYCEEEDIKNILSGSNEKGEFEYRRERGKINRIGYIYQTEGYEFGDETPFVLSWEQYIAAGRPNKITTEEFERIKESQKEINE
jgi:hypothetical protein